jgi:hypothetical protein
VQRHKKKPELGRRYFHGTLSEAVMSKPMPSTGQAKGGSRFDCSIWCSSDAVEQLVV